METENGWKYLVRKPRSVYKQLFVKDRWVAARSLYGQIVGEGSRTPEELAADYSLPLDAVLEAIAYCESAPPEIREDWDREQASVRLTVIGNPDKGQIAPILVSPQDRARINQV